MLIPTPQALSTALLTELKVKGSFHLQPSLRGPAILSDQGGCAMINSLKRLIFSRSARPFNLARTIPRDDLLRAVALAKCSQVTQRVTNIKAGFDLDQPKLVVWLLFLLRLLLAVPQSLLT